MTVVIQRHVISNQTIVAGRLDRKAVTMLYNAISDLEIRTQQRRDLIGEWRIRQHAP